MFTDRACICLKFQRLVESVTIFVKIFGLSVSGQVTVGTSIGRDMGQRQNIVTVRNSGYVSIYSRFVLGSGASSSLAIIGLRVHDLLWVLVMLLLV